MINAMTLSRRQFNLAAVAGGLVVGLPGFGEGQAQAQGVEINSWIVVAPDNTVTLRIAQQEMGQGTITSMAQLLGEELEVDWNKMKTEFIDVTVHLERNKVYGRVASNASRGITASHELLRMVGAQMRGMFVTAASKRLNAPEAEFYAENSTIIHRPSGRKLTYGELALETAKLPPTDPKTITLKDPKDWKLIGKSVKRLDVPTKADGSAIFGIDVMVPGMKTAAIMLSPVFGGRLKSFDAKAAMAFPGVRGVVPLDGGLELGNPGKTDFGIAVVADTYWQARTALDAMPKEWDGGANAAVSSADFLKDFKIGATAAVEKPLKKIGDIDAALKSSAKVLQAEYWVPFLEHATMEPMNCTALVTDDRFEVWVPTQNPEGTMDVAARTAGLPPAKGKINITLLGGGFGRRGRQDFTSYAVQVAKAMKGTPVKTVYTREETTRHGYYRPATLASMRAGLDANGNLTAWGHRNVGHGTSPVVSTLGSDDLPYAFPNMLVDYAQRPGPVPLGTFRGIAYTQNNFFVQGFLDEVAIAAGKDLYTLQKELLDPARIPATMEKRDQHVERVGRVRKVMDEVARKSDWGKPLGPNRGRGLAVEEEAGSVVALVTEVTLDDSGWFSVDRIVIAADTGFLVNPSNAEFQLQGSMVYGLTAALYGEITINNGRVVQGNFDDYQMLRINEMPKIETYFVLDGKNWGGIGEPGVGPIMSATVNAIYNAGGPRIRSLPLKNENIVKRT